jgi:hypothetical protein
MVRPPVSAPFAKILHGDVGFVLVVGGQDFNRLAENTPAKLGDRHLDRLDPARTEKVGVRARHVVEVADHHLVAGGGGRASGQESTQGP